MKKKSFSTLGYIMEALNIQTVSMSRFIHVDASLVSKWKTGDRTLSEKSIYFDDIIDYIMDQSTNTIHQNLENALINLYPHEKIEDEIHLENLLRQALSSNQPRNKSPEYQLNLDKSNSISALTFKGNYGRREAITKLLDYADSMTTPGEFLFIDNEEFNWLLEDSTYAHEFVKHIENLIHKGFRATFVLHYSSYKSRLIQLFDLCSPLIFHRNINWYYKEYYDTTIINFSFFILNHAVLLLGFSSDYTNSSTMIFTDSTLVFQHEAMARQMISHYNALFTNFKISDIRTVINGVSQFRKRGSMYSFLPSPLFMIVKEALLRNILLSNDVSNDIIDKCVDLNHKLRNLVFEFFTTDNNQKKDDFIYIFHLEAILNRAKNGEFLSTSLGLACKKNILISPKHYATELRDLVNLMMTYDNLKIILVSDKDNISIPSINCWCKQNIWMLQMNKDGLRLSDEYSIVNAASTKWEQCLHTVPPERKDKNSVSQFLLELAEELETK